ncbi:hypothetical protein [Limnoglobus roseus]|uniref:Phage tail protein n=1 Tax=Limnoglobus roseus TaxID=2598579 RepID=A0A5C1A9S6_9BACT|nr:hypothetical protein [Limnoglobus roseus]QEL13874.1 hypothetical protein PX52LOC_00732 [Limnoglobus roseus]
MAILGIGSTLGYSTDGGSTFTTIPECTSISITMGTHDKIENVHLGITDNTKDFLIGLSDPGEIAFKFNFAATVFTGLMAIKGMIKSGSNEIKWKVTGPDPDGAGSGVPQTYTVKGGLMELMFSEFPVNGIIVVDGKVACRGAVTVG